jgi:hypothetical protein
MQIIKVVIFLNTYIYVYIYIYIYICMCVYVYGGKQCQTSPKNLLRMQRTTAMPVA